MKKLLATCATCVVLATTAGAQTLSIFPDKPFYHVGELMFFTVVGDSQELGSPRVFGFVRYTPFLGMAVGLQSLMQPVTSQNGAIKWVPGKPQCGVFGCTGFTHSQGNTSFPPDGPIISLMVHYANSTGPAPSPPSASVSLDWATEGGRALDFFGLESAPGVTVDILQTLDITPGEDPDSGNPINLASSTIPVAILSSELFDALDVDPDTVLFGTNPLTRPPPSAPPIHQNFPHFEDVNGDGLIDLVAHFATAETGLLPPDPTTGFPGDTSGCITALLLDGSPFTACDGLEVKVPSCGIGFELALLLPPLMWVYGRRRRA